ncbi:MAG: DUF2147 domain-containing protein [Termitinemataceae bacterium]|nr:MAG: DUF2147 domain-containing protein [Termitinemataceae bacterium]
MKKIFFITVILSIVLPASVFASDPVEGYWFSVDDKSGVVKSSWIIYEKDGLLYGKIIALAGFPQDVKALPCNKTYNGFPASGNVNEMTVVGTTWIWGLKKQSSGVWKDGSIINPEDGGMYKSKIIFHAADGKKYKADTLEVRGEIGPFGKSQFWKKASKESAEALK